MAVVDPFSFVENRSLAIARASEGRPAAVRASKHPHGKRRIDRTPAEGAAAMGTNPPISVLAH